MRIIRNLSFVLLVIVTAVASDRKVSADWNNWEGSWPGPFTFFGACQNAGDCEEDIGQGVYYGCYQRCLGYVSSYSCTWTGEVAEYPDNPNCFADCDCNVPRGGGGSD
jgi:hypothetical protein